MSLQISKKQNLQILLGTANSPRLVGPAQPYQSNQPLQLGTVAQQRVIAPTYQAPQPLQPVDTMTASPLRQGEFGAFNDLVSQYNKISDASSHQKFLNDITNIADNGKGDYQLAAKDLQRKLNPTMLDKIGQGIIDNSGFNAIKTFGTGIGTALAYTNPTVQQAVSSDPNFAQQLQNNTDPRAIIPAALGTGLALTTAGLSKTVVDTGLGLLSKKTIVPTLVNAAKGAVAGGITMPAITAATEAVSSGLATGKVGVDPNNVINSILPGMGYGAVFSSKVPQVQQAGGATVKFLKDAQTGPEGQRGSIKIPGKEPTPQVGKTELKQVSQTPVKPAKNGALQEVKQGLSDADQVILDELRSIEKQTGQKGLVDKFMYNSNMQRGSNATANVALRTSQNLTDAIGGLSKREYADFSKYSNAKTELGSAKKGTPLSQPKEVLQTIVSQGDVAQGARFDALNQHYKELADFAHQNGLIDTATLNRYKADNNYIRIQRDMGDLLSVNSGKGNGYSLGSTVMSQKRIGSKRDILPAGETAATYTQQIYREAAKNRTSTQLLDSLSKNGLAEKLNSSAAARHQNVSKLLRNGKVEYYRVSPEIKQAIDNINPYSMNIVMRIAAAPGRLARAGITGLNPVFIARNLLKDQVGTAINSEHLVGTHNPRSFFSGLFHATTDAIGINHDPIYQDFLKHYGDTTSYDLTRNVKNTNQVINRIRGGKIVGVGQALKAPIRSLENIASITEKSTRFQNYRGMYKAAIKAGLAPEQASEKAAMAAWQNSVDFGRAGTWGRTINTVIPYWNPATQGVRQMGRTLSKHPIKSSVTATALIGVPLAAATAWNLSDPQTAAIYNNIPEYEKDNNLILIPPGTVQNQDGSYDVVKIPLAPGWKDVFMPVRRSMEAFAQDKPADYTKMAQDILQAVGGPVNVQSPGAFAGSFIPQVAKPFVQQAANQDLFSGNKIVPDYMQQATDAQGNPIAENKKAYNSTSGTARQVGDFFGVSPVRVEKAVKDVAGTVGLQGLNAVDTAQASMGTIPKDQIGGQSVTAGYKKSFGSAQGIDNANASAGSKYFDNLKIATTGLNQNEQAAFTSLHPSSKNFLGDTISEMDSTYNPAARLDIYNRYPKVFAADKALDQKNREANGFGNPLFDLTPEQVKVVLEHDNLPPGAKDPQLSTLYSQEWYSTYATDKSQYFKNVQDSIAKQLTNAQTSGDTTKVASLQTSIDKFNSPANPYPVTSPELQKAMDYYSSLPKGTGARSGWIKSNPGAWQAMQDNFAAIDNWQNNQRANRGLAATEGATGTDNGYTAYTQSSGSSYGGGSGKSGGSGGYKKADPTLNAYKYAVSINAGGKAPAAIKAKKSSVSLRNDKVGSKVSVKSNPKVSIRKSKV